MEEQLEASYEREPDFRQEMDHALVNYSKAVPAAQGKPDGILERFSDELWFWYGWLQPDADRPRDLYLQIIKAFAGLPAKGYRLVYFVGEASSAAYADFKRVFLELPLPFLVHLREFAAVGVSFYSRTAEYFAFGQLPRYLKAKTCHFGSCQEVLSHYGIAQRHFVSFVPSPLRRGFAAELGAVDPVDNRKNVEEHLRTSAEKAANKKFFDEVRKMVSVEPQRLGDYVARPTQQTSEVGVPTILELLVLYFHHHPDSLGLEGIFRKSVAKSEEEATFARLRAGDLRCLDQITNPLLVANLIKRFFASLKEPVVPYAFFPEFMALTPDRSCHRSLLDRLPALSRNSLMFLCEFLADQVLAHPENLMTAHALAVVFAPCLMHSPEVTADEIAFTLKAVKIIEMWLTHIDELFGTKQDRLAVYRSSYFAARRTLRESL